MKNKKDKYGQKLILSTVEVSKMLLLKGHRKIDESIISKQKKITTKNIDISEITSQINMKMSKEVSLADQSIMYGGLGEKSLLYKKSCKNLDKTSFCYGKEGNTQVAGQNFNNKQEEKTILNNKQQTDINNIQDKNKEISKIQNKNIIQKDSKEFNDVQNTIKFNYILNTYFPYEIESNFKGTDKIKNFEVLFYFQIEKDTFLLIKRIDNKLNRSYFWNKEEDALKFGIKYSQVSTPGIYFKTLDNFYNSFEQKFKLLESRELLKNSQNKFNKLDNQYKEYIKTNNEIINKMQNEYNELILKNTNKNNLIKEKDKIIDNLNQQINLLNNKINELNINNKNEINENEKVQNISELIDKNNSYKENNSNSILDKEMVIENIININIIKENKINDLNLKNKQKSADVPYKDKSFNNKYFNDDILNSMINDKNNEITLLKTKIESLNEENIILNKIIEELKFLLQNNSYS